MDKVKSWGYVSRRSGKKYDCIFFGKAVQAVGPLPSSGNPGARSPRFKVDAESEEEAKRKIEEIIDREG